MPARHPHRRPARLGVLKRAGRLAEESRPGPSWRPVAPHLAFRGMSAANGIFPSAAVCIASSLTACEKFVPKPLSTDSISPATSSGCVLSRRFEQKELQRKSWPADGAREPMCSIVYNRDQKRIAIKTNIKFERSDGRGSAHLPALPHRKSHRRGHHLRSNDHLLSSLWRYKVLCHHILTKTAGYLERPYYHHSRHRRRHGI